MDGITLALFLGSLFAGGIVTGLAGFAFGLVVSGLWLQILTPAQTTSLIIGYGFFTQGYGMWRLRHALNWRLFLPIVIGNTVGVPIGVWLLAYTNPAYLRLAVGTMLVIYSAYGLAAPAITPVKGNLAAELGVGVFNGILGGMAGLAGVFVTVWCHIRGWPRDVQRAVYQPVIFASLIVTAISLAVSGSITAETIRLYIYGIPFLLAGTWAGMKLYGWLNEIAFRTVILLLLLVSGIALIVPELFFR